MEGRRRNAPAVALVVGLVTWVPLVGCGPAGGDAEGGARAASPVAEGSSA